MAVGKLRTVIAGASALVKRLCDELGLARIIDARVHWDERQCKLSPGTRIVALVVNALTHRRPLYKVSEFYAEQDVELLFGTGVQAGDFNDDALARALDALAEAEPKTLFSQLALTAVLHDRIPVRILHGDTTSFSVYGDYDQPGEHLTLTYGNSKGHRPDLKQFLYGLITTAEGIPLAADVADGNLSDRTWNRQVLESFEGLLNGQVKADEVIYVADSALVTGPNLQRIAQKKIRFISRLPATFALEQQVKEAAWQAQAWQEVGALAQRRGAERYAVWETQGELEGRRYRLLVVRSSAQDRRKEHALQRRLEQEAHALHRAARALARQTFACEADALAARERFLAEHASALHGLSARVKPETRLRRPRGRPRKDAPPPAVETRWRVEVSIDPPPEARLQAEREKQAPFVLLTNVPREALSAADVLREYKQQVSVERRFPFLKDPVIVDGIYLKRADRAYALAYVFLFALLIAALLERRVRCTLRERGDTLTLEGRRVTDQPTLRGILELFRSLQIVVVDTGQEVVRLLPTNTNPQALKVLRLLGYSEAIYTQKAS